MLGNKSLTSKVKERREWYVTKSLFIRSTLRRSRLKGLLENKYLFCSFAGSLGSRACEVFLFSTLTRADEFVEGNIRSSSTSSFCTPAHSVKLHCLFLFAFIFIQSVFIDRARSRTRQHLPFLMVKLRCHSREYYFQGRPRNAPQTVATAFSEGNFKYERSDRFILLFQICEWL